VRRALYPGTFDPVTNGHLDLIKRALRLFDGVTVAVGTAHDKSPMFSVGERIAFIKDAVGELGDVDVVPLDGLLVDTVAETGAVAIMRGLREVSDFEYEFQMALMNRRLYPPVETVFLTPKEEFLYLSSRLVREVVALGGDVSGLVPDTVRKVLEARYRGGPDSPSR
jgi:pantetheine-phosphate adenylyltransferase